jgi:hypothetical protein
MVEVVPGNLGWSNSYDRVSMVGMDLANEPNFFQNFSLFAVHNPFKLLLSCSIFGQQIQTAQEEWGISLLAFHLGC